MTLNVTFGTTVQNIPFIFVYINNEICSFPILFVGSRDIILLHDKFLPIYVMFLSKKNESLIKIRK